MAPGLSDLLRRAKRILQTEGLAPLVRQAFSFVVPRFFRYESYYLYEYATENVAGLNEADFMPKIDNFTLKIVSTNHEADELAAEGLEFRSHVINARERLEKGAVAFCIFVERELASIEWVPLTQQANDSINEPPYHVDFSREAVSGDVWTNPKYRNRGLHTYSRFKRLQWLLDRGIVVSRSATRKSNVPANVSAAKLSTKVTEARYLKILWWKSWKEKPLILGNGSAPTS